MSFLLDIWRKIVQSFGGNVVIENMLIASVLVDYNFKIQTTIGSNMVIAVTAQKASWSYMRNGN